MKCLHVLWSMAMLSLLLFSCNMQKKLNVAPEKTAKESKVPILEWDKKMVELGKIQKGDIREFDYTFTNVSNIPMQLEIVTTCHCTTLEYPSSTKVFKKGESGNNLSGSYWFLGGSFQYGDSKLPLNDEGEVIGKHNYFAIPFGLGFQKTLLESYYFDFQFGLNIKPTENIGNSGVVLGFKVGKVF